ncbi:MAG: type I-G CRISPR-associated protein Csb2, partial [Acidobacteriota bacterium]
MPFRLVPLEDGLSPLTLRHTLAVCHRWQEALISRTNDLPSPVREILSGHAATGEPLQGAHLAFLPIPQDAQDSSLFGLAAAIPATLAESEIRQVFFALGRVDELALGSLGRWRLVCPSTFPAHERRWLAHESALCGPATHWATATPIVFDRHPKAKSEAGALRETTAMIEQACLRAGLPRPCQITLSRASALPGHPPAQAFPFLARKDGSPRSHTHALLVFPHPVRGPILLGAGRYKGYGLCRA